jgi:hypothetical protein
MSDKKNYDVGYGKPPKSGQFKPGQSGNPKGRPKGAVGLNAAFEKTLRRKVSITEGGKSKRVTCAEALTLTLAKKAFEGDLKSVETIMRFATMLSHQAAATDAVPEVLDGPSEDQDKETLQQLLTMMNVEMPEDGDGTDDES